MKHTTRCSPAQGTAAASAFLWIGLVFAGCSFGPSAIRAVDVDPSDLSQAIMDAHDSDGNGSLSADELKAIPPIYDGRTKYDADGDGAISTAELTARLEKVFDPNMGGVVPVRCRVTRNGAPLNDAEVRFVPPQVLQGVLPQATGMTEGNGTASLRLAPEDMPKNFPNPRVPVMRPGIYLVEVTHAALPVPPQYNTQTTLGKEVFAEVLNGPPLAIDLRF